MERIEINFFSKILNRNADISLILPSYNFGCNTEGINSDDYYKETYKNKLRLLILLHGSSGDHTSWLYSSKVEAYAEEHNIAGVMISGENKYYLNNQIEKFYDVIEIELKDYLYGTFPISSVRIITLLPDSQWANMVRCIADSAITEHIKLSERLVLLQNYRTIVNQE